MIFTTGVAATSFETDQDRVTFLATIPIHPEASIVIEEVSEKTEESLVIAIKKDPYITISELSEKMGVATRTIERHLAKLKDSGRVKRIGADRGGHWEVLG